MRRSMKVLSTGLAAGLFAVAPLTASGRATVTDAVEAANVEQSIDLVTDRTAEVVDRVREPDTERRPPVDPRGDRIIEHEVDRLIDRCHPRIVDNSRRCLDDERPHDFNVRHLIWRLIKAHEWEKLVRLLHWLGWL